MNNFTKILALCLTLLVAAACSKQTRYEDPGKVEVLNSEFGSTDLLMIAQTMTDSFIGSTNWEGDRPKIVFG